MKKKILLLTLPFLLISCNKPNEGNGEERSGDPVSIVEESGLSKVYGGTTLAISASTSPKNVDLDWSVSDASIASISNGIISFADVNEEKEVTIKASWKKNAENFDEIKFKVLPNPINTSSSSNFNPAIFNVDGIKITNSSEKVVFKNAASETFIYKASLNPVSAAAEGGTFGFYLYDGSSSLDDAYLKIKVDGKPILKTEGYPYLHIECGGETTKVTIPHTSAFKENRFIAFGVAKFGTDLLLFGEGNDSFYCIERFNDRFAAADTYQVGIFTDGFDLSIKDCFSSISKDDILFGEPTILFPEEKEKTLFEGEGYNFRVSGNLLNFNPDKIRFSSSDPEIATIDEEGNVLALKEGDITLTATYGEAGASVDVPLHVKLALKQYNITLDKDSSPADFGKNVPILASNGEPYKWNYVGGSHLAGKHVQLANAGYIQNEDELKNLSLLTIKASGSFKLHTGFECYEDVLTFDLNGERSFDLSNVGYFKLESIGNSTVDSIYAEFNNQDTIGKDLLLGASDDPMFDVVNWNRLVHDVDTSSSFTYTVSFRQITDETNYLKRPSFFVYPAEYDDDDVILHTATKHYFYGTGGYYQVRQGNSQLCHAARYNTDKGICQEGAWIDDGVAGIKEAAEGGLWGGTTTTNARYTRDCIMTATFKLESWGGPDEREQKWTCTLQTESFYGGYEGILTKTYTLQTEGRNIFPCERVGIAIGIGAYMTSSFKILSASSTGIR